MYKCVLSPAEVDKNARSGPQRHSINTIAGAGISLTTHMLTECNKMICF